MRADAGVLEMMMVMTGAARTETAAVAAGGCWCRYW